MKKYYSGSSKTPKETYIFKSVVHSLIDIAVLVICTALFVVAIINLDIEKPENSSLIKVAIVSVVLFIITLIQRRSFSGMINALASVLSALIALLSIIIILLVTYINSMPKDEWSYIVVVSFFNGIKTMIISMPKNVWILYGIVLFITALPKILKHDK